MSEKKKQNYVDKEELTLALIAYADSVKEAEKAGEEKPRVPEYLGKSIYEICNRYSYSPSFMNYPFREDMVSDAIVTILKYMHNFDPAKSRNPHSYFTQFAFFAFLSRIKDEKKKYHTKAKYVQTNQMHMDVTNQDNSEFAKSFGSDYYKYVQTLYDVELGEFDPKPKKSKKKSPSSTPGPLGEFEE